MGCFDFLNKRQREREKSFRYTIMDVFSIKGRGLVVVGQVEMGSVHVGDKLMLTRTDRTSMEVEVGGLERFREGMVESATEGDNVGIFLKGDITKDDVGCGDVLTK